MKLLIILNSYIRLLILMLFEIKLITANKLKLNSNQDLNNLPLVNSTVFTNKNQNGIKVNKKNFFDESVWLRIFEESNIKSLNEFKVNTIINGNLKGSIEKTKDLFYKLNLNNVNDPTIVSSEFKYKK